MKDPQGGARSDKDDISVENIYKQNYNIQDNIS